MGADCGSLRYEVSLENSPVILLDFNCFYLVPVHSIVRSGDAIYVRVGDHDLTSR